MGTGPPSPQSAILQSSPETSNHFDDRFVKKVSAKSKRIGNRRLRRFDNISFKDHPLIVRGEVVLEARDLIPSGYAERIVNPSPINRLIRASAKARSKASKQGITSSHDTAAHLLRHLEKELYYNLQEQEKIKLEKHKQRMEERRLNDSMSAMVEDGLLRLTQADRQLKKQISPGMQSWIEERERELLSWKSGKVQPTQDSRVVRWSKDVLVWETETAFLRLLLHAMCRFHQVKSHSQSETVDRRLTFVERFKSHQEEVELSVSVDKMRLSKKDATVDLTNEMQRLTVDSPVGLLAFSHYLFA